jgi:hypothetical protein
LAGCPTQPTPPETTSTPTPAAKTKTEDEAVAFIQKLGGKIERDEKAAGKPVVEVNLAETAVTDVGLKELAPLKNLHYLNVAVTQVSNAGLKELAPLTNLKELTLSYTRIDDAGFKELAPFTNLEELILAKTPVNGLTPSTSCQVFGHLPKNLALLRHHRDSSLSLPRSATFPVPVPSIKPVLFCGFPAIWHWFC